MPRSMQHQALQDCKNQLFGYAYALTGDAEQAAELFQDCALRAMSSESPPLERRAVRAWLFRVMRNLWIDSLRSQRRRNALIEDVGEYDEPPVAMRIEKVVVNRIAVRQAFALLGKDHRDVLALVDIGGFAYQEAADILGVPKGTIMSRVSRARQALAAILSDSEVKQLPRVARG